MATKDEKTHLSFTPPTPSAPIVAPDTFVDVVVKNQRAIEYDKVFYPPGATFKMKQEDVSKNSEYVELAPKPVYENRIQPVSSDFTRDA